MLLVFRINFYCFSLNKNPCQEDKEEGFGLINGVPPPCCEACGINDYGIRPGSPQELWITVARQRRTRTGFGILPSHPGVRHRGRFLFTY